MDPGTEKTKGGFPTHVMAGSIVVGFMLFAIAMMVVSKRNNERRAMQHERLSSPKQDVANPAFAGMDESTAVLIDDQLATKDEGGRAAHPRSLDLVAGEGITLDIQSSDDEDLTL
jgi:hypothetical protein